MTSTPRLTKSAWPEHITNALGIPTVQGKGGSWQSTGDTTDVSWFRTMCDYLGIEYPNERIRAMRAILEQVGGTWDQARHSSAVPGKTPGGNVRREAFEDLWKALASSGLITPEGQPGVTPGSSPVADALPELTSVWRAILRRQGQPRFRAQLLRAYGARCAITGTDVEQALEAAHIRSHAEGGTMNPSNGLLLRADLHTLFDLRLIAIDTSDWKVLVNPSLVGTHFGASLAKASLRIPSDPDDHPSTDLLDEHREKSGL